MPRVTDYPKLNFIERLIVRIITSVTRTSRERFKLFSSIAHIAERLALSESHNLLRERHLHYTSSVELLVRSAVDFKTVWDVGCSTGLKTVLIAKRFPNASIFGVDNDCKKIEIANDERDPAIDNIVYLAGRLEDQDLTTISRRNEPSLLFLSHVLEHMCDPEQFLKSFSDKFTHIYIEVPDFESSYLGPIRDILTLQIIPWDSDHKFEFTRKEIKGILQNCELKILLSEYQHGVIRIICTKK